MVRGSVGKSVLNPLGNSNSAEMGIHANKRKKILLKSIIVKYIISPKAGNANG